MSITMQFPDGREAKMKPVSDLKEIDKTRRAVFMMNNTDVYIGFCVKMDSETGRVFVSSKEESVVYILPQKQIYGWCYNPEALKGPPKE